MKNLWILMVFLAMAIWIAPVSGAEINDHGIALKATGPNIQVGVSFLKNEPNDRSKDGMVKYSIPYDGTSKSDGYLYAKAGDVFEGHLGYADKKDLVAEAVVGRDGNGPLIFTFPNPTKAGEQPVDMVFWAVLKGTNNQYICPPWEPKRLYFARPDSRHPKGTMHVIAFAVSGEQVYDVIKKVAAKGWKPAYVYWQEKGVMGGPASWNMENLMTGQAPAETVKK